MKARCETCNLEFSRPLSHIKRVTRSFCSVACHNEAQKDRVFKNCVVCGGVFGVPKSMSRRYVTCFNIECRLENKKNSNNPNWRGGVVKGRHKLDSLGIYKKWRKEIFLRDCYTCQKCGKRGGDLEVDHILPWTFFPELRFDMDNGRTLCLGCHRSTFRIASAWKKMRDGEIRKLVKILKNIIPYKNNLVC